MVEDAKAAILSGTDPFDVSVQHAVDIAKSLAPFIAIYDQKQKPIYSTGILDGQPPLPPSGVFAKTLDGKDNRVTWQPRPDVRIALVVIHFDGNNPGYILAGRSLREVETRVSDLAVMIFIGWFFALIGTLAFVFLSVILS